MLSFLSSENCFAGHGLSTTGLDPPESFSSIVVIIWRYTLQVPEWSRWIGWCWLWTNLVLIYGLPVDPPLFRVSSSPFHVSRCIQTCINIVASSSVGVFVVSSCFWHWFHTFSKSQPWCDFYDGASGSISITTAFMFTSFFDSATSKPLHIALLARGSAFVRCKLNRLSVSVWC